MMRIRAEIEIKRTANGTNFLKKLLKFVAWKIDSSAIGSKVIWCRRGTNLVLHVRKITPSSTSFLSYRRAFESSTVLSFESSTVLSNSWLIFPFLKLRVSELECYCNKMKPYAHKLVQ